MGTPRLVPSALPGIRYANSRISWMIVGSIPKFEGLMAAKVIIVISLVRVASSVCAAGVIWW